MASEQSNFSGLVGWLVGWLVGFCPSLVSAVRENGNIWFAKRAKDEEDDFCMCCHLPAYISRSEMLTFLPNFLSLLDQAPCLFVSPNEHHFTFDGYWIDHCCHGLWWTIVFTVLPPNRLWGLFESAHALFGVRFIERKRGDDLRLQNRGDAVKFEGPALLFHPVLSHGLFSHSSSRGLCSCSSFCWKDNTSLESWQLSQGEEQLKRGHLTALAPGPSARVERSMSSSAGLMLLPKTQWQQRILQPLGRGWEEISQVD